MDEDNFGEEMSRRVQARFVTNLKPPLKVPSASIAIPANLTRLGLSTVVNNLIQSGNPEWNPEPFDFLIDGELIRMSLEQFLLAKGISAEKILEIEYIRAVAPRNEEDASGHEDWVSAVDGSNPRFILTGCYDGLGRVWEAPGSCSHILGGHSDAITSVSVIDQEGRTVYRMWRCNLNDPMLKLKIAKFIYKLDPIGAISFSAETVQGAKSVCMATASKDRTLRLWKIHNEASLNSPATIRAFKILRGHKASVQSVSARSAGDMICSGSWDCTINLWNTKEMGADDNPVTVKKRKVNNQVEESQIEDEAVSTLVGHTQCVSSVIWPHPETIYSTSWDHSVRRWDVETGKDLLNIFCGKVLNCLDIGGEASALIAAGGSDPVLRIWDPRKPASSAPIFQFSSHTSWISACKWHNKSWFHLLSASYDGKIMLWDLRTAWPLAVVDSHKEKVFCADWWRGDCVVSGGMDSKLRISSGIPIQ